MVLSILTIVHLGIANVRTLPPRDGIASGHVVDTVLDTFIERVDNWSVGVFLYVIATAIGLIVYLEVFVDVGA